MGYAISLMKDTGGYTSWFENSYNALFEHYDDIGVSDEMYEQHYNVMVTVTAVHFKSEADAMMFLLKWN